MPPLYIFDLDGTLADAEHRMHYIQGEVQDWGGFFAACPADKPIFPVVRVMHSLLYHGAEVWVWTGRSGEVLELTRQWLLSHTLLLPNTVLRMRGLKDRRPDYLVKDGWLRGMALHDRERLVAVFENRQRVVDMWRANGVACFHVAEGKF